MPNLLLAMVPDERFPTLAALPAAFPVGLASRVRDLHLSIPPSDQQERPQGSATD